MPLRAIAKLIPRKLDAHGLIRLGSVAGGIRIISVASGIVLTIMLARVLGPGDYGHYLYALSLAQIIAMPVLSGLPALLTRQLAIYRAHEDWSRLRGIMRWARRFVAATAFLVLALGGTLLWLTRAGETAGTLYIWTLLLVIGMTQMQLGIAMLNGFERPLAASLPDGTIRPLLLLGFVAALAFAGRLHADSAMFAHFIAALSAALWAAWHFRRKCQPMFATASTAPPIIEGRTWLLSLMPLGIITFSSMINARVDTFMLGIISTKTEVAHYGIALQISGLVSLGSSLILGIAGPRMARMWAQDSHAEIISLIRSINLVMVSSVAAAWALLTVFGGTIINGLIGGDYARSFYLAVLTSAIPFVAAVLGPAPILLLMTSNQKTYLRNSLYMVLTNVCLNLLLIPIYGAVGAVGASIFSALIFHIQMTRDAYRICGIRTDIFSYRTRTGR